MLAIDLGTGGPKVALVDAARAAPSAWSSVPSRRRLLPGGGAEQDPEAMWSAVVGACRHALAACPTAADDRGGGGDQPVHERRAGPQGRHSDRAVHHVDGHPGRGEQPRACSNDESFALFLDRHGLIPLPSGSDNIAHISVLRDLHPDAYAAAAAFVEPMDYVNARITGRVCCDPVDGVLDSLLRQPYMGRHRATTRSRGRGRARPRQARPAGADERLRRRGHRRAAAAELGIRAGIPVTAATIDSITSAIGTGALGPADGSVVIGTTSVLVSHIDSKRGDLMGGLLAVPSPLPGMYYVMAENGVGGRALEWFLRSVVYADDAFATAAPDDLYDRAMAAAATAPAGSDGAQFLPWLLGSIAPHPNDDVRAAFVGLGLGTTRAAPRPCGAGGRRPQPGVAAPVRRERSSTTRSRVLRFGGGGAMSPLWAQILADATGRPVDRLDAPARDERTRRRVPRLRRARRARHRRHAGAAPRRQLATNPTRAPGRAWTRCAAPPHRPSSHHCPPLNGA